MTDVDTSEVNDVIVLVRRCGVLRVQTLTRGCERDTLIRPERSGMLVLNLASGCASYRTCEPSFCIMCCGLCHHICPLHIQWHEAHEQAAGQICTDILSQIRHTCGVIEAQYNLLTARPLLNTRATSAVY